MSDLKRLLAMGAGLIVTFGAMLAVWQTNGSTTRVVMIGLLGAWVTSRATLYRGEAPDA